MFISASTASLTISEEWPRPSAELLARFANASAANVADAFDRLLVMDGAISPVTKSTRIVGSALTILTRAGDNLAIHRALDDAKPGDVLVVSGQGDLNRALIGDLIGEIMRTRGVLGAVIDGAVRDATGLSEQGLAVFARALTPAGPFKNGPGVIGAPVSCGGVVVNPGDLIVADEDGVTVVPASRMKWAADRVEQIIDAENALRAEILVSATNAASLPHPDGR
jgi:regulator of RNase E activity RraA